VAGGAGLATGKSGVRGGAVIGVATTGFAGSAFGVGLPGTTAPHFLHLTARSAQSAGMRNTVWQPGHVDRTFADIVGRPLGGESCHFDPF
jgi:hypothetical protein